MSAPAGDRRPSHDHLMAAEEALGKARDAEQAAGNDLVAELLNQLVLTVFKVAIQEGLDEFLAQARTGGAT